MCVCMYKYHFNLFYRVIQNISEGPLQVVSWSRGHSLAYVQNNNVYYVADVARPDVVKALTTDGKLGEVYYGVADWIYEGIIIVI